MKTIVLKPKLLKNPLFFHVYFTDSFSFFPAINFIYPFFDSLLLHRGLKNETGFCCLASRTQQVLAYVLGRATQN